MDWVAFVERCGGCLSGSSIVHCVFRLLDDLDNDNS